MLTDWNEDDIGDDNEDVADRWDKNGYRIDNAYGLPPKKADKDILQWMEAARKQTKDKLAGMKKAIMEKEDE